MKRLFITFAALAAIGAASALAQVYPGPAQPTALVCAYNSVVPTPVAGKFFFVQCNASGRIMVQ